MSNKPTNHITTILSRHITAWYAPTIATRAKFFAMMIAVIAMVSPSIQAQTTVAIANPIPVIFGGAGVTAVYPGYTNAQVSFTMTTNLGGTLDPVDLAVTVVGSPAGVTAGLVPNDMNPGTAGNIFSSFQVSLPSATNTVTTNVWLAVSLVNAPKGNYQLEITASNTVSTVVVTNSTTMLVLPNLFTAASGTDTNWSTAANWSLGSAPVAGDSARFQYPAGVSNAHFDTSIVLDSFELMPLTDNLFTTNYLAPGVTIAVNGPYGFRAGADRYVPSGQDGRFNFTMVGSGGSLVVTNPDAVFSIYNLVHTGGGNRGISDLGALGNLRADVSLFGAGSEFLAYPRLPGTPTPPAENGIYALAMTNIIRATYVGDYSGAGRMTNSFMAMNNGGNGNGNFASQVLLGWTNVFFADSMSALSHQSANASSIFRFNPLVIGGANTPVAYFRGTNGGRMSYFGVAVESGGTPQFTGRTRGSGVDFAGGRVDMLVETLVLSQNQTNRNGNYSEGRLTYTNGIVDANTVRLGYRAPSAFTPASATGVRPLLTIGGGSTEARLNVNSSMNFMEGFFTETASGSSFARLVVNTNGRAYINNIVYGTNNRIVEDSSTNFVNPAAGSSIAVNNGGHLVLTNTMGTLSAPMPQLTVQASGQLTFHVTAGVTNASVTTLSDSAGAKINIASLTGFSPTVPATNVLIHYANTTGAGAHPIAIGTIPSGYNNVTIFDNAADQNIELRIQTNAPATLIWKGYVNNVWDHSTPNWYNPANNSQVTFFDADTVVFAETNSPNFKTIDVSETVLPAATYMSNSASAYAFEGAGNIGGNPMTKQGTADLTNNVVNGSVLQLEGGTLYGSSPGVIGGVTISSGAGMSYGGSITAGLTVNSGAQATLLSGGIANGPVSVSGVMTNEGTIQGGSLSVNGTALLVNNASGTLQNIGNSGSGNVASGATLINVGNIGAPGQANSLTINGTFKEMGVGTIYLTTLTCNSGATFHPGGDGIGITSIKSPGAGTLPGRLALLIGSTTIIKVDFATAQTNTIVESVITGFGENVAVKSFNGATILVTNINPGAGLLSSGQSFRMFRNSAAVPNLNIGNAGLNTTNRYPIVQPIIPAVNTKWDLASLIDTDPNGFINISFFPTTGTNITYSGFADGGSFVSHLQWPSDYIGWRLQQQTNALDVGLSNNWTDITGSSTTNDIYVTNSLSIPASFFRMVYP